MPELPLRNLYRESYFLAPDPRSLEEHLVFFSTPFNFHLVKKKSTLKIHRELSPHQRRDDYESVCRSICAISPLALSLSLSPSLSAKFRFAVYFFFFFFFFLFPLFSRVR